MWWPSFVSVVHDLYDFVRGRRSQLAVAHGPGTVLAAPPSPVVSVTAAPLPVVLHENIRYAAAHETTATIRQTLKDELTLLTGTGDLLPSEWLLYRYYTAGKTLPWSALLITTIGQWHETLRAKRGVDMTVTPRTGSLMEWQDGMQGYIGELTTVTPDESVTVRILGTPLPGVLTTVTYTKDQWRELRPVFITVT